ncbi:dehydrodolichyl diphosphate synthase complex subunit NUS1 [Panulirus ornatus]|uniref:dehydrodolichyl diphosphate synthase complex subunit NUS1 n=1 Tax=Panulirus ornatus TaxID=150431 RepID=UPI003A84E9F0
MDVLLPMFQLLYFVAHFLASLALSVIDTFRDLHRLLLHFYCFFVPTRVPACRLQADAAQLKKIPQHLGLVCVGQQVNHIAQLTAVISWAVGYGVHYVSLYDVRGILKRKRSVILKALQESSPGFTYYLSHDQDCIQVRDVLYEKDFKINNGVLHRIVTVNLLSAIDGRGNLASAAQHLSKKGCQITETMIESLLVTQGQPDPDMVITIGKPITTLGFIPWQIRLSEFFSIPSLSRFEYHDFQSMLQKYSKCEQRFGK